jgi:hypothetical protein
LACKLAAESTRPNIEQKYIENVALTGAEKWVITTNSAAELAAQRQTLPGIALAVARVSPRDSCRACFYSLALASSAGACNEDRPGFTAL